MGAGHEQHEVCRKASVTPVITRQGHAPILLDPAHRVQRSPPP
jgi:hypothetical protein